MKIFEGRIARRHYWVGSLLTAVVFTIFATSLSSSIFGTSQVVLYIFLGLTVIGGWAFILFGLSLFIRRFHDFGYSGWWSLLVLIPYLGVIPAIILGCIPSNDGENHYGKISEGKYFDVLLGRKR